MQSKTIWLFTILLVIATLFSVLTLASGTTLPENTTESGFDHSSSSVSGVSNDGRYILLKAAQFNTEEVTFASSMASTESISPSENDEYYIVQFKGFILEEWKQDVRNTGAIIFDYVPNNAFIVRMNASVKAEVENLDSVQWIGPYHPSYRISPALSSIPEDPGQVDIIVVLFDAEDNERILNEITGLGGEIVDDAGDIIRVKIDRTKISDIAALDGVSWIENHLQPVLLNNNATIIMNVIPARNNYGLNGSEQIIGIADTGLDTGVNDTSMHDDLEGRIKEIYSWGDSDASDGHGHGTHVAGSAMGNGLNSSGLYSGAAPEAQLVFQAIGDSVGNLYSVDLNALFTQAYSDGARIHSNSWGVNNSSKYGSYTSRSQTVDEFMWNQPEMLILFAAGNSRQYSINESILPPATAKNCLSVGASENFRPPYLSADNPDDIASFSSCGPTDDGRIKPDVIAPGTWIASIRSSQAGTGNYWGIVDDDYAYMGGTSMSTPLTAGTAALVRQYYVENDPIPPSAALIKATLVNGAVDTGNHVNNQGWGRVDLYNSLFPSSPVGIRYFDNKTGLSNESWHTEQYISSGPPLKISLVWTDYPASLSAADTLVNNLDLKLESPNTTIYYGNGAPDTKNNVEQIYLEVTEGGWYNISVNGINIPSGPQPFALVISGAFTNDTTAPSSVTGLSGDPGETWINWSWTNPSDPDFDHVEIYLDGFFKLNSSSTSYNATGLSADTSYELSTRTVDTDGNINTTWVNDTATTLDLTAPASVTSLDESSVSGSSITWNWTNPADPDFSHTMIYLNNVFTANVSDPDSSYVATGLDEATIYQISTRTVDTDGNIN
ncbi:S8 family serine peptidase, partial [Methanococcoides sp. NM1]|uniref:S8 family serine peptidase n=1 Tax=Methanococcoides sp. NM1 TaxID=1201013 RepID=UPI0014382B4A